MKKFHENIWFGTLKECVDEFYSLIDFVHCEMPRVDFAAIVDGEAKTAYEAYRTAESWFGFKCMSHEFDGDTVALLFGHYGGGGVESLELTGNPEIDKEAIIDKIANSTDNCGLGQLKTDEYTVFELE